MTFTQRGKKKKNRRKKDREILIPAWEGILKKRRVFAPIKELMGTMRRGKVCDHEGCVLFALFIGPRYKLLRRNY